jgi:prophage DNA circulation protein
VTWFDDLRRVTLPDGRKMIGGSFRGVPFFVESSEISGGRRAQTHEFPFRDDPFVEDLGRKARGFRFDAYVIGDDYLTQKDALLAALETEGPGELVHPYHGLLRAIALAFTVRTSRSDGGMATFAIDFAETPLQAPVPTLAIDSAEQVSDAADTAIAAAQSSFVDSYDAEGMPAFGLASAETAFKNAVAAFESEVAPIVTATQELATLTGQVELLTAEAASLVRDPGAILGAFRGAIVGLAETALSAPGDLMDALFAMYLADLGAPVVATTKTRERELDNQIALQAGLRRVIACEAARLAPTVEYTSIDEALAARDLVAAMLEEQATSSDDTAYPAIVDLRSSVLRAVPGSSSFARIVTVTRNVAIPSLLLAYQLYGSVDREADLVARNQIKHPGFVAGDLQALSDE